MDLRGNRDFTLKDVALRIRLSDGAVESFMANIPEKLVRTADGSGFVLQGTDASLIFVPHFSQHEERYGIYFKFADADGGQRQQ